MSEQDQPKESKLEPIKRESRHLRGTIGETLATDTTHFSKDENQLLKFHGIYQQDDRDQRHERRQRGEEEAYQLMVRCAIPAGVVTADQYLELDKLADAYTDGSIRVTVRQGIQFHGVLKKNIKRHIKRINDTLLTTLSACGDVERNVMACCAPLSDEAHVTLRRVAGEIARQLRPASRAYHEIWLDEEKQVTTANEEPFYGDQYLPRKFKTGIALADDNCVDVYTQDVGLIAIVEGDRLVGFNLTVGGGLGMTHSKPDTFARLGEQLGFIEPDCAVEAAQTVAAIFRDFGNREDRRHARLKYLIADRGIDWMREEFQRRASFTLHAWRAVPRPVCQDHLGRHGQNDGRYFYGVYIESGRIRDNGQGKIRTAFREIVQRLKPGITLTPHQNLLFTNLSESDVGEIERTLSEHGVRLVEELSAARRYSMACPALPTCGLAMAESERFMPSLVDQIEETLAKLGMRDEPLTLRMTGCPNGCARPYTADIAFVGRRPEVYQVYVGGGLGGDRMVDLFAADVPADKIVKTLYPLLESWAKQRHAGESLSDYYQRLLQHDRPRMSVTGKESPTIELIQLGEGI